MIEVGKHLPFKQCETCVLFEPNIVTTKMFGNDSCLVNVVEVQCEHEVLCENLRRMIEEEKTDAAE